MASTSTRYSEQHDQAQTGRQGRVCRPFGTLLGSRDPSAEAAALAADLSALVDAGLIRRVRDGSEIRFELTEPGGSTPAQEA